jgi:hypothetical protein
MRLDMRSARITRRTFFSRCSSCFHENGFVNSPPYQMLCHVRCRCLGSSSYCSKSPCSSTRCNRSPLQIRATLTFNSATVFVALAVNRPPKGAWVRVERGTRTESTWGGHMESARTSSTIESTWHHCISTGRIGLGEAGPHRRRDALAVNKPPAGHRPSHVSWCVRKSKPRWRNHATILAQASNRL